MRYWYRRGLVAWALWPASLVFRFAVALRRLAYWLRLLPSAHPGIAVIVVGNLVAGGSGKTPLVIWIAEQLKKKGWTPAIVSRGYGGAGGAPCAATIASQAADVGDEPIVLARRSGCPVWIGADRLAVIKALRAVHSEVDVLVLDDGLQHYRLRRDLEIAVVDGRGFGNGFMLPAGPLREPVSRLRSVDAVVSHGAKVGGYAMRLAGAELHRMTNAAERRPASACTFCPVNAASGRRSAAFVMRCTSAPTRRIA